MAEIEEIEDAAPAPKSEQKPKRAVKQATAQTPPENPEKPLPPAAPDMTPHPAVPEWVVERDITVAWQGRLVKLRAGTIVSDASYGANCAERFRRVGVSLLPKAL